MNFLKVVGRKNILASGYVVNVNLEVKLKNVFNEYREFYLVFTDDITVDEIWVDLIAQDRNNLDLGMNLNTFIININQYTLTIVEPINTRLTYPVYQDGVYSGYHYTLSRVGMDDYDATKAAIRDLYKDVRLTRPNTPTDMVMLHSKALVSVNGYLHLTDTDGVNTWIIDAAASMVNSGNNHIGIFSFSTIPDLTKVPVKNLTITKDSHYSLYEKMYITLPEDLINDEPKMLSLFGYMQFEEDNVFYKVADDRYVLQLANTPYLERIYELFNYMNIAEKLELTVSPTNPTAFDSNELISDIIVTRLMNLSQSFLINIPVKNAVITKFYLKTTNMPGHVTSYKEPKSPMMAGYGKMTEYWKRNHHGVWEVTMVDAVMENFIMSHLPDPYLGVVNRHRPPINTYQLSRTFLLELGLYL